uniref:Neuronal regeneration-related protein n=1 Tax=Gopherus agassizii TaxID=38772 RepID=A0A452I5R3_9SAUR
ELPTGLLVAWSAVPPYLQGDKHMGNLTIPKEVNRKKNNETEAAFLTPANGYGYHFTEINYLYPF